MAEKYVEDSEIKKKVICNKTMTFSDNTEGDAFNSQAKRGTMNKIFKISDNRDEDPGSSKVRALLQKHQ